MTVTADLKRKLECRRQSARWSILRRNVTNNAQLSLYATSLCVFMRLIFLISTLNHFDRNSTDIHGHKNTIVYLVDSLLKAVWPTCCNFTNIELHKYWSVEIGNPGLEPNRTTIQGQLEQSSKLNKWYYLRNGVIDVFTAVQNTNRKSSILFLAQSFMTLISDI